MANTNVRSKYIQQIAEDKEALANAFANTAKESLSALLDESVKNNLRQIISEGDSYTEDETDDPTKKTPGEESDTESVDVTSEVEDETGADGDESANIETDVQVTDAGEENAESDEWEGYEEFKGEDGQYDFTGMDQDQLVKVFRELTPEDGVTVVKDGDDTIKLHDDETDRSYIIDLGDDNNEAGNELGESKDVIDDYQKQSAMTVDSNKEVANPKTTYSMDGGVPQGTEKPFPGEGDKAPYDNQVKESDENFEIELDDEKPVNEGGHTVAQHSAQTHSTTVSELPDTSANSQGRNSRINGEVKHTTSENPYSVGESRVRAISKRANEIFEENKQLRQILAKSTQRLQEAIVVNRNMGFIIKTIMENTTTNEEKRSIATRFSNVKTIEEGKRLYESISGELKARPVPQVEPQVTITESVNKGNTATRPMYQSNDMTDFMKRMDAVYRKH